MPVEVLRVLFAERAAGRETTLRDWFALHPPPDHLFRQTLAGVGLRVRGGEDLLFCVREFLDEFAVAPRPELRVRALATPPEPTGELHADAFLGALAEHLASRHGLARPVWATEPGRFLDRFWFVSVTPGFGALAVAEAPAAFRRRGIFLPAGTLARC